MEAGVSLKRKTLRCGL